MGVDSYVRFTLRMPDEVREKLAMYAMDNYRSLNSEILAILQEKCEQLEAKKKDEQAKGV